MSLAAIIAPPKHTRGFSLAEATARMNDLRKQGWNNLCVLLYSVQPEARYEVVGKRPHTNRLIRILAVALAAIGVCQNSNNVIGAQSLTAFYVPAASSQI